MALDLDRIRSTAASAASSAGPSDGEILLLSDEDDPQLRWRFTDIRPDSFTWRGEISRDGGATWAQDEEMRITRRDGGGRSVTCTA